MSQNQIFRNTCSLIVFLYLFFSPQNSLAQTLEDVYSDSLIRICGKKVGIYIENIKTGQVICDVNGEEQFIPASVTKVITTASLLSSTSPDSIFVTRVEYSGKINSDSVLDGDILIFPSGDPTLDSAYFPENITFIDSIIDNLKLMGVKRITGGVKVINPMKWEWSVPSGWKIEDLYWPYGTPLNHLNFKDNRVGISLPDKSMNPPVPDIKINVTKSKKGAGVSLNETFNLVTVSRRAVKRKATHVFANHFPHLATIATLKQQLEANGIIFENKKLNPTSLTNKIYYHKSPKYYDICASLMKRSDNLMAEGMLVSSTNGNRSKAIRQELELWSSRGIDTSDIIIEDGSGLSRNNRITPYFLADVLCWMAENDNCNYTETFPLAGVSGTMRNFLKDTDLEGRLATKTGSMSDVQCYAGYLLDDEGNPSHVVVIMINGFIGGRAALKKSVSDFLLQKFQ